MQHPHGSVCLAIIVHKNSASNAWNWERELELPSPKVPLLHKCRRMYNIDPSNQGEHHCWRGYKHRRGWIDTRSWSVLVELYPDAHRVARPCVKATSRAALPAWRPHCLPWSLPCSWQVHSTTDKAVVAITAHSRSTRGVDCAIFLLDLRLRVVACTCS